MLADEPMPARIRNYKAQHHAGFFLLDARLCVVKERATEIFLDT